MRYELYAVEVLARSRPETYALATRYGEDGPGSPLTWATREAAQRFIDQAASEAGDPDPDMRVVPLTGETDSENEPDDGAYFAGDRLLSEPVSLERAVELSRMF